MSTLRTIAAGTYGASRQARLLVSLRGQLDGMNRQLATGKRAESLGGLDAGRSSAMAMRARLSQNGAFGAVIERGLVRAGLMSGAVDQLRTIAASGRSDALTAASATSTISIAASRSRAIVGLDGAIAALNSDFDGQYLFSGRSSGTKPVISSSAMLDGDASGDGLITLIDERRQADLGSGLGRLALAGAGSVVTLSEEQAGLPFGLKLSRVASAMPGVGLSGPAGSPPALTIDLATPPQAGQSLDIGFTLPDGSSETITLTAGAGATPFDETGRFAVSADPVASADNLRNALAARLGVLARTELSAASSMAAATDFLAGSASQPVRRIAGPPFASASGFVSDGSRPTVTWYRGDDAAGISARSTQQMAIDHGVTIEVGARANEAPVSRMMAGLAAMAAEASGSASLDLNTYRALADRASHALGALDGSGRGLAADLAVAQEAMGRAEARHTQMNAVFQNIIADVEVPDMEELSTSILTLQTRLQASYQVTAGLSKMSLSNYI